MESRHSSRSSPNHREEPRYEEHYHLLANAMRELKAQYMRSTQVTAQSSGVVICS